MRMAAKSANCESAHPLILQSQRMAGLTGRTVACLSVIEWQVWAVRKVCVMWGNGQCCTGSDGREEPRVTDAATCMNTGFWSHSSQTQKLVFRS
ncbi:hypothetical protein SAMN05444358_10817 [Ruegeria halocynthiae]|uniref:Uncharacterized protein n=1 Tax=Ruegeria halocynthiae TaxID=985054 RepID=A0A1H3D858_9RHOB|nr:hypothetical protein SAMN05444358_10817 [Ruegeria halocynthiae]